MKILATLILIVAISILLRSFWRIANDDVDQGMRDMVRGGIVILIGFVVAMGPLIARGLI